MDRNQSSLRGDSRPTPRIGGGDIMVRGLDELAISLDMERRKKKNTELAGATVDAKKQKVTFDKPIKTITLNTLIELVSRIADKEFGKQKKEILKAAKAIGLSMEQIEALEKYITMPIDLEQAKTWIRILREKNNPTYGNMSTMTLRNNKGQIVAKLYILPDGRLANDSWLCNEGWK